ncbi:hypothetical protein F5050DRAFT_1578700, partial [Lentinula boryana]
MSWNEILAHPLFSKTSTAKSTLKRAYRDAKAHGNDCYWTGWKDHPPGRARRISSDALDNVTTQFDEGVLRDGAHAQRCCFPDVSERTVRRNLSKVGYKGFVQPKKPLLKPEH